MDNNNIDEKETPGETWVMRNATPSASNGQSVTLPKSIANSTNAASTQEKTQRTWFQRNALRLFVFNFSILQLVQMMFVVYYIAVVRTIERRYGLTSTSSGIIMSLNDVIHISVVVFIGYIGRKAHKPILIGSTAIFLFISAIMYASPYFIYGSEHYAEGAADGASNSTLHASKQQFCESNNNVTDECDDLANASKEYTSNSVFYILSVGSALSGLGGCALNILGMAYVDQNAEKHESAFYLGIITSSFSLGPIFGIVMGAVCLSLPEDMQGKQVFRSFLYSVYYSDDLCESNAIRIRHSGVLETDMKPSDPAWIGAWWLGYVISAVLLLVFTIPMFFYPKHIKPSTAKSPDSSQKPDQPNSLMEQIKGFFLQFHLCSKQVSE